MEQCATSWPDCMRVLVNFHWGPTLFFQGESWAWNCMDLLIVGSAIFETLVQVRPYRHGQLSHAVTMSQWNACINMSCARSHWLWYMQRLGCIGLVLNVFEFCSALKVTSNQGLKGRQPRALPPTLVWRVCRICGSFESFASRGWCVSPALHGSHDAWHREDFEALCCPSFAPNCPQTKQSSMPLVGFKLGKLRFWASLKKNQMKVQSNYSGFWEEHREAIRQLWQAMNLWYLIEMDGWMDG